VRGNLQTLRSLRDRVKTHVERGEKLNEADTKAVLVEPLLEWLGWDIRSTGEVKREWRRKSRDEPVDYALMDAGNPTLLVEAKSLRDPLRSDKGWRQLAANGLNAGFQWCVRTNGRLLVLVNLLHKAALEGKVFWTIDLLHLDEPDGLSAQEGARRLELLTKQALSSGQTDAAWDAQQAQMKARAAAESLLTSPPDALIDLVREEADDPQLPDDVVAECLAGLIGKEPRVRRRKKPPKRSRKRRITVADLLAAELAKAGDRWRVRVKGQEVFAEVAADGSLAVEGDTYASPSGAGRRATGGSSVDGWLLWKYQDSGGSWRPIDHLRKRLMEEPSEEGTRFPWAMEQHLEGRPRSRELFEHLLARTRDAVRDVRVHANSKHIVLSHRYAFVVISVQAEGLRMGLRLDPSEAQGHARLKVQPKGIFEGWSALHVSTKVSDSADVDDELLGLMKRAYEAAE